MSDGTTSEYIDLTTATNSFSYVNCTSTSTTNSQCKVKSINMGTGTINSVYGVTKAIAAKSTLATCKNLARRELFDERRHMTVTNANTASISNPVICLEIGESMIFTITSYSHYPVYVKDSILNSNANFDYGPFIDLATKIKAKSANGDTDNVIFGFTFSEAGNYMFSDAKDTENYMYVVVTSDSGRCPSDTSYSQPMTSRQLASSGGS